MRHALTAVMRELTEPWGQLHVLLEDQATAAQTASLDALEAFVRAWAPLNLLRVRADDDGLRRVLLGARSRMKENGGAVEGLLPKTLLAYFDQFGRSLRDDERVEFRRNTAANDVVVYDRRIRKTLVLKSATVYRTEESVRGSMSELNLENRTFTLKLISGEKVVGQFSDELRGAALGALGAYGESLVMVEGTVVRDQSDNRKRIEQVTRIEPLDPLDVPARLESLALLRDGWLDGHGVRLSPAGLGWLSKAWADAWPDEAPLPCVYPTPEGDVRLEWSSPLGSVTAEVNLDNRRADVLASRTADGEVLEEAALSLADASQWQALTALVARQLKTEDWAT